MAKKVFLVDDSDLIRSMATMALEASGHLVRALPNWQELDAALAGDRPDLILMDINMPEMTGDFALTFFKEERGLVDVPILLYSDIDEQSLVMRAQACGADGYISKGWGLERLTETVDYFLHRAG
ncbi:MAG TPA: response regulator [Myxococcota bacterium]|nr:response regulator [Myxococcota bacterium]HRY95664.1 response regulator [Myxococcota bacterium]HSA21282.1 response regulator [Myxococcota bacterium]